VKKIYPFFYLVFICVNLWLIFPLSQLSNLFLQNAQNFRDAPRLRRTAARIVRRVAVENFGNLSGSGLLEMLLNPSRISVTRVSSVGENFPRASTNAPMSHAQTVP
jgi:hypothetical protein